MLQCHLRQSPRRLTWQFYTFSGEVMQTDCFDVLMVATLAEGNTTGLAWLKVLAQLAMQKASAASVV